MIADLDETIERLLEQELPIRNGEVDVKFDQPKREWSARINRPTVNFFLYDLRENPTLRQHQWEQASMNNGLRSENGHLARLKRTPFRVDCFYMITTWATEPEDEHRLLTRTLLALFRFPILPEDRLAGSLKEQPFEIQARLAQHDRLTNPAEVWSALDNEIRPSISYIVTLALDPWQEVTGPLVRTVDLRSGQSAAQGQQSSLPQSTGLVEGTLTESVNFGGTVTEKEGGAPLPGVSVAVKGTGLVTTTDLQGRYRLGSLPPGKYTLVAWPAEGSPLEKSVTILSPNGDYNFEI